MEERRRGEEEEARAACVFSDGIVEIVRKMFGFLLDNWGLRGRMSGKRVRRGGSPLCFDIWDLKAVRKKAMRVMWKQDPNAGISGNHIN